MSYIRHLFHLKVIHTQLGLVKEFIFKVFEFIAFFEILSFLVKFQLFEVTDFTKKYVVHVYSQILTKKMTKIQKKKINSKTLKET